MKPRLELKQRIPLIRWRTRHAVSGISSCESADAKRSDHAGYGGVGHAGPSPSGGAGVVPPLPTARCSALSAPIAFIFASRACFEAHVTYPLTVSVLDDPKYAEGLAFGLKGDTGVTILEGATA